MQTITLYILPFLRAVSVMVFVGWILSRFLEHLPKSLQWMRKYLFRSGGVLLASVFCLTIVYDSHLVVDRPLGLLLAGILSVLAFGVADDILKFPWHTQFMFQLLLITFLFSFGIGIHSVVLPVIGHWSIVFQWVSYLVTTAWLLVIINAVNWADGVDGVAGSVSGIGFFTIFLLALRPEVYQPPIAIIALIATGVTLGFLFFNFSPAKFIAGTAGSYFWGLLLGVLAIFAGTKIATTLLVLSLPLIDALWVVINRLRSGVSIFQGDQHFHLHYRLRERGWSDRRIALTYIGISAILGLIAPFYSSLQKGMIFVGILLLSGLIFAMKK
jgi:UDP-GlcNAc:undecaprenyl-phosphate GlcNAc-1-phosphate transferase